MILATSIEPNNVRLKGALRVFCCQKIEGTSLSVSKAASFVAFPITVQSDRKLDMHQYARQFACRLSEKDEKHREERNQTPKSQVRNTQTLQQQE